MGQGTFEKTSNETAEQLGFLEPLPQEKSVDKEVTDKPAVANGGRIRGATGADNSGGVGVY